MLTPEPRKRGRPLRESGDPLGLYLRALRTARGLTVRDLARRVGLSETSAAYISQLEAGTKNPSANLAGKLEVALGDKLGVFALWSLLRRDADPRLASQARRRLAQLLDAPELARDTRYSMIEDVRFGRAAQQLEGRSIDATPPTARPEPSPGLLRRAARALGLGSASAARPTDPPAAHTAPVAERGSLNTPPDRLTDPAASTGADRGVDPEAPVELHMRLAAERASRLSSSDVARAHVLMVPLYAEGDDPRDHKPIDQVRLSLESLHLAHVFQPLAYRVGPADADRTSGLLREGDIVVISREQLRVVPDEVYAVRHAGRVMLTLALWNGVQLLLLPGAGRSDFVVIEPGTAQPLENIVLGHVGVVVRSGS